HRDEDNSMRTLRNQIVSFLVTSCLGLTGAIGDASAQPARKVGQAAPPPPPAPPPAPPQNGPGVVEEEVVGGPAPPAQGTPPAPPPPGAPPVPEETVGGQQTEGVVTTGKKAMREDIVVTG